ncbi:MAG: DNA repair protein RecO [Lachnospiraceae bacterium]|nr:DNA repair protein RecO [Lachnospiraceae bacterium]
MDNRIEVHGIVLKHRPVGEYDWIVTLLTAERGRLNAFARGARKPSGKLSGNTEPFCFGSFGLFPGKNSYGLQDARIDYYFEGFRKNLTQAAYATFFLELAEYYTRENLPAAEYLNLLFLSLKALEADTEGLPPRLIRCVYELRATVTEGIFPGEEMYHGGNTAVQKALRHIGTCPLQKLYTFSLSEEALSELDAWTVSLRKRVVDRPLRSLEMLAMVE